MIDISKINTIKRFNHVSETLVTSGLPTKEEFAQLKEAGVQVVINLIPPTSENEKQPDLCAIQEAGFFYFAVPFYLSNPIACIEMFKTIMDEVKDKNILVHCSINWRASVFTDTYFQLTTGKVNEKAYFPDLDLLEEAKEHPVFIETIRNIEKHYNISVIRSFND